MVDKILFRQVCSMFATGVTVVTTGREGNFHGMTANAFAVGVSLEPTLVLVCLDRNSRTCALLDDTGAFTINILSEEQQEVSRVFASRDLDAHRFEGLDYRTGPNGTPVLAGCIATMQCSVFSRQDAGDHAIFVGEVTEADVTEDGAAPLVYFRSAYRRLAD
jgi:3-hydroxy-9,10-secoandrosta-1,3,5(10)-triene-9,17-dione monooxygenase reductase component